MPSGHLAEHLDPALRATKRLGDVARFATAFAPHDGEELTEPLAELSDLE